MHRLPLDVQVPRLKGVGVADALLVNPPIPYILILAGMRPKLCVTVSVCVAVGVLPTPDVEDCTGELFAKDDVVAKDAVVTESAPAGPYTLEAVMKLAVVANDAVPNNVPLFQFNTV